MRIRNRIMQMIDVERHYYSHKNGISVLIGVSFFLLSFNIIFNAFYCFGVADDARSLLSFRQSIYLLVGYLILFFIYATMIRYIGFSYPIVLCYTAVSYIVNAVSGFLVTKASYSWTLNVLIDNPVGFEAYARRAYQEAYSNITTIIVAYLIISLIPAFRRRSYLLGRLWFFNLLTPLLVLPPMVLVILLVPEEEKLDYAYTSIVAYISLMAFYSVRYLLKTLYYLLLFPSRRRMKLVKLSSKRYGKLVNRKPGLFKRHIPLLSENVFDNQELSNVTEATVGSAEPTEATVGSAEPTEATVGSAELTELTEGSVGNAEPTTATNGSAEQVQSEDIENEPSAEKDFSEPMPYSIAVMDINPNETESDVDNTIGPEDIPSVSLSNLEDVQKESDDINQSDIPIDIVEIESDEEINVATSDEDNAGTTETTDDTQQEKIDEEDDEPQLGDDIIESSITDEVIEDTSDEVSVVNETSEDDKSDSDNNSEQHEETDTKTDSKTESDDTDDIPEETNDDPTVELIEEVVDETNNISEASDNDSVVESEEDTINKTDDEEQEIINTELSE